MKCRASRPLLRFLPIGVLLACALAAFETRATAAPEPLEGRRAPALDLERWVGLPEGRETLEVADLRGRVVVLTMIDGAGREGLPALREVLRRRRAGDNAPAHLLVLLPNPRAATDLDAEARRLFLELRIPVGAGSSEALVRAYGPPGRPFTVIVDPRGIVRYAGAGTDAARIVAVRDALDDAWRGSIPIVGRAFGPVGTLRFFGAEDPAFESRSLTIVRWWTMHCPHCAASVPALSALARRHAQDGVALLPVYHFKGGRRPDAETLRRTLAARGHRGPFATDPGWRKLRDVMRRAGFERATSVTYLVDREGRVVWAHPGPRVHASSGAGHVGPDADLRALEAWIEAKLDEAATPARHE